MKIEDKNWQQVCKIINTIKNHHKEQDKVMSLLDLGCDNFFVRSSDELIEELIESAAVLCGLENDEPFWWYIYENDCGSRALKDDDEFTVANLDDFRLHLERSYD